MTNIYDQAAEQLRKDHSTSLDQRAAGWFWGCSCGREGKGSGTRTPAGAQAAANRHLQTEHRRILAALAAEQTKDCKTCDATGTVRVWSALNPVGFLVSCPDCSRPTN